jgi:two-component system, OmpR family, phosphate regulon sensor histidine kinase PhoR
MEIVVIVVLAVALGGLSVIAWRQRAENARVKADLRKSENELVYKRALMLTLANGAYDALIVVDEDCCIMGINTSAERLFNRERPIGESLSDVTDVPELAMMVRDVLVNEEDTLEEQVIIGERNFRVRSQLMRRDGHGFVGLALQDITQLVRLNRARRDMVANISHELRTPIANIRVIIDGLFLDQDKPKRKDSISSLRAIARETEALLWLVQEMSDLSMIESGQAIVRMVDVPLGELVEGAVERMEDIGAQKNVTIKHRTPPDLHVLCDRDLAQRVIVNLIHNAVKWSPEGEVVTVEAAANTEDVTISVLDNGPGVPDEQVERIFERFYQVDASRSAGEGTGLGLAICKHIVEAHGGRIWAEGNSGGAGGLFRFTLLKAEEQEPESEERVV